MFGHYSEEFHPWVLIVLLAFAALCAAFSIGCGVGRREACREIERKMNEVSDQD